MKNQKGSVLINVLIIGAVASIVTLSLFAINDMMMKAQKSADLGNEVDFVKSQLSTVFGVDDLCKQSFSGQTYNTALNSEVPANFSVDYKFNTPMSFAEGADLNNGLTIHTLKIHNYTDPTQAIAFVDTASGQAYKLFQAYFVMAFKKTDASLFAPMSPKDESFKMNFYINNAGTVAGCVAQNSEVTACQDSGGLWNPFAAKEKCAPRTYGRSYGSYAAPPAGNVKAWAFKNPFTNDYSCPQGTIAYQSGVITDMTSMGKAGVSDSYFPVYRCLSNSPMNYASNINTSLPSQVVEAITEADMNQAADDYAAEMEAACTKMEGTYYRGDEDRGFAGYCSTTSTSTTTTTTLPPTTTTTTTTFGP